MTGSNETQNTFAPEMLFSVPIWLRTVVDHERINKDLRTKIGALEASGSSIKRSNVGGWHSAADLHFNEDFAEIRRIIGTACAQCAESLGFDFNGYHLKFAEMWANRNGPGAYNRAHIHPNAFLSGAYYVTLPPDAGDIEFYDPVRERTMQALPLKSRSLLNSQSVEYECEEGSLVIFPAWLQHAVAANNSSSDRISISFNMFVEKTSPETPGTT
ncbi:MAG: TIGR02466 family protein [Rhodobiaceae bacterium]|nr:TIGR02466 family protein [Rhodobiaceae bacterium]